jgi:hypothetical protein
MQTRKLREARALPAWTYHELDEGETWEQYGMEQPNRTFGHRRDWPYCKVCRR